MTYQMMYPSPIGTLYIVCNETHLLNISKKEQSVPYQQHHLLLKTIDQLDAYFKGQLKRFEIPLLFKDISPFAQKVYLETEKIPYGKTASYQDIAIKTGHKSAYRACGNALNKNPFMIVIPCHRVISKSGQIGGFAHNLNIKKALLKIEGLSM